jgi:RNA polymerase sigma-70 factor (ECF subfamily)
MMTSIQDDTDVLLSRAANGDVRARDELFRRNRTRLKRAVQVRLDGRLSARIDPSDIVQDSLLDASEKLDQFIRERPLPFYAWLRQVALDRLKKAHRFHLRTQRRAVSRETDVDERDASGVKLAEFLATQSATPSQAVQLAEQRRLLESAVARLSDADREILVMRYLEEMSSAEAAAALGITLNGYAQRHVRAVQRLGKFMGKKG